LTNIFIFVLFFLYFLINSFGVSNILYWKKLFIFINIVCATLLSPPDVYSQIIILFFLSFIFESLIFINLYFLNLDIGYEKLIRQHIKRN
jgi:Sec-independent protein secretion pathway component TatC